MEHAIVYFDGVCNFCNAVVNFIIAHDKKDYFRFVSLQSEHGQQFLKQQGFPSEKLETFYIDDGKKIYSYSTAALRLAKHLSGVYSWGYAFIIIPRFIRDPVYNFISEHRYKIFGRQDRCIIPSPEMRAKFL
ncbi:MAG: thiol-disulfide oxidoreductase DCC family protein [Chitinophagales bacterium]